MPRQPRYCPVGVPVHIIQRGNNRQILFTSDNDFAAYANWLYKGAAKFKVKVHGWVFMSNHVHILVTPQQENAVSQLNQYIGRLYVRYFNYTYARSGTLFEGRFKSSLIQQEDYLLTCLRYIELNPVRAGMVADPADYMWSSYRMHGFGIQSRLWNPHPLYLELGENDVMRQKSYRELMSEGLSGGVITEIRRCSQTGQAFGSRKFRMEVASTKVS